MSGWDGHAAEQAEAAYYADPAGAAAELAAYEADEARLLGCDHDDDELDEDDHLARCLYDPAAAKRLEQAEAQWDAQGVSGYEL